MGLIILKTGVVILTIVNIAKNVHQNLHSSQKNAIVTKLNELKKTFTTEGEDKEGNGQSQLLDSKHLEEIFRILYFFCVKILPEKSVINY